MIDFQRDLIFKLRKDNGSRINDVAPLLVPGENLIGSYTSNRDRVAFTDKRIICCNTQGITGKKKDYTSIPYAKISCFSVETAGLLDLDSELEIHMSGVGKIHFDFAGNCDIVAIGQAIGTFILK